MYKLILANTFQKNYQKITKNNQLLKKKVKNSLYLLAKDPFYPSLRTHKVTSKNHGLKLSSFVSADIRIIWDFHNNQATILLLSIGKHTGRYRVYN